MVLEDKILDMVQAGESIGFTPSDMGHNYVKMVVQKGKARRELHMNTDAFTNDKLLSSLMSDARQELHKWTK